MITFLGVIRGLRGERSALCEKKNLYATSTLASDNDCPFEDTIASLLLMLLPSGHDPSHAVFQQGYTAATTIENYLLLN